MQKGWPKNVGESVFAGLGGGRGVRGGVAGRLRGCGPQSEQTLEPSVWLVKAMNVSVCGIVSVRRCVCVCVSA